jgi:putative Mg2+ transporter-C (MgtC) family protein
MSADFWELLGRLVLALLAGGVLGWEREAQDKPAGLRTHMMVALGAAIFMAVSEDFMEGFAGFEGWQPDPLRVLQGIVGGVGFLGAGSIIQSRGAVQGITTAATIWLAAAVGSAAGLGYYAITVASVFLALVTLILFGILEARLFKKNESGAQQADHSD